MKTRNLIPIILAIAAVLVITSTIINLVELGKLKVTRLRLESELEERNLELESELEELQEKFKDLIEPDPKKKFRDNETVKFIESFDDTEDSGTQTGEATETLEEESAP